MKKPTRLFLVFGSILSALCLAGCTKPGPAQEAGRHIDEAIEKQSKAEANLIGTSTSDTDITAKVKMALMMRDGIDSVTISVKTHAGVVALTGSVVNASQSQVAEELAMAVDGVTRVDNRLAVVSAAK